MEAIIFEDINDKFGYGTYLSFKVIIMKDNGYINASKMLKSISEDIGKNKEMDAWKRLEHTSELIKSFEDDIKNGCPGNPGDLIIKIENGKNELRGQYVHPNLIVHIASWASPKFAAKVSKIVNEYVVDNYKKEIKKHNREIEKQKDKVEKRDKFLNVMDETILIYKTSNDDEYYVCRVGKQNKRSAINRCEKVNKFTKIGEIGLSKNSVAVFNRIMTMLKLDNDIKRKGNYIKLNGKSIQDVIEEINKIVSL